MFVDTAFLIQVKCVTVILFLVRTETNSEILSELIHFINLILAHFYKNCIYNMSKGYKLISGPRFSGNSIPVFPENTILYLISD